jgi:hydrogenase expression/formation protein HypD
MQLAGFIGPGHVSTIIGTQPFEFVPDRYRLPMVISGFEPLDILQSIVMILRQLDDGLHAIENQYARVVRPEGNRGALGALLQTMELRPYFEWRGLGFISHSALKLRPEFGQWDAEHHFDIPGVRVTDPKACQCGEVLKGVLKPWECKVFGTACTPERPIGTCMVSPEGACAAYFSYGRYSLMRQAGAEVPFST